MFRKSNAHMHTVTAEDHARITETIRAVEKQTSGEVYAVVAHQSDSYFFVSGFMAAVWTLLLGAIIAFVAWYQGIDLSAQLLVSAQIASFIATLICIWLVPALCFLLVPRSIAYRRASQNAVRQFLAHGIHTTQDRSGVLLFVSLAEHYAEVVADAGINAKVSQSEWDGIVEIMTDNAAKGNVADGFVEAIKVAGALLALNFPPDERQHNELDDRLVEI